MVECDDGSGHIENHFGIFLLGCQFTYLVTLQIYFSNLYKACTRRFHRSTVNNVGGGEKETTQILIDRKMQK